MAARMPSGGPGKQGWEPKKSPNENTGLPRQDKFIVIGPGHEQKKEPGKPGTQTHETKSDDAGKDRPGTTKKS